MTPGDYVLQVIVTDKLAKEKYRWPRSPWTSRSVHKWGGPPARRAVTVGSGFRVRTLPDL